MVSTRVGEEAREECELDMLLSGRVVGLGDESLIAGRRGLLYMNSSSHGGVLVKFFEQFWGIQVLVINPRVFRSGVPFPVHEVLEHLASPLPPGIPY